MNKNTGAISQFSADLSKTNAAVQSAQSQRAGYAKQGAVQNDHLVNNLQFTDPASMQQYDSTSSLLTPTLMTPTLNQPITKTQPQMTPSQQQQPQQQYAQHTQHTQIAHPQHQQQQQQQRQQQMQQMQQLQQMQMQQLQQKQQDAVNILQQQQQFIDLQAQSMLQQQQMKQLQQQQQQQQILELQKQVAMMENQVQAQVQAQAQAQQEKEQDSLAAFSTLRQQQSDYDLQAELEDEIVEVQKTTEQTEFDDIVGDQDLTEGWEQRLADGETNPYGELNSVYDDLPNMFSTMNLSDTHDIMQQDLNDDGDNQLGERDWNEFLQNLKYQEYQPPVYLYSNPQKESEVEYIKNTPEAERTIEGDNALQQGIELFNRGEVTLAIERFETATRLDSQNSEGWCWLGQCWAQQEEDSQAIAALEQAIVVDPYSLRALLMLGVSYTNNLDGTRALQHLRTWLQNHPEYALMDDSLTTDGGNNDGDIIEVDTSENALNNGLYSPLSHETILKMFRNAAEIAPNDADIWVVLGVLYNLSSDFTHAVESFQEATKLRPEDPELWNKLGATLANSNRSQDAVAAYDRALTLRPTYIRARSNLGIAYYNSGQHWDAARVFLSCLELNSSPQHLWSFLRMSFSYVGRDDLAQLAREKDVSLFKQHLDF